MKGFYKEFFLFGIRQFRFLFQRIVFSISHSNVISEGLVTKFSLQKSVESLLGFIFIIIIGLFLRFLGIRRITLRSFFLVLMYFLFQILHRRLDIQGTVFLLLRDRVGQLSFFKRGGRGGGKLFVTQVIVDIFLGEDGVFFLEPVVGQRNYVRVLA